MKKIILYFMLALILGACKPIPKREVKETAVSYLKGSYNDPNSITIESVKVYEDTIPPYFSSEMSFPDFG